MEVEIKLNVKPAIEGGPASLFTKLTLMQNLGGYPLGQISKAEIRDLYFDTADGALAKAGAGLRLRVQEGLPFVTLKINKVQDGALTRREEFEEPLTEERFNWVLSQVQEQIGAEPVSFADFAAGRQAGSLLPVLEVGTARLSRDVGQEATLTMDMVEYPGLSAYPYFDVEVEANQGKAGESFLRTVETELYRLAGGDLAPAKLSKLERGLKLKERLKAK